MQNLTENIKINKETKKLLLHLKIDLEKTNIDETILYLIKTFEDQRQ